MKSIFSLEGKKAIVTGAAKKTGLCYACVQALIDAGAEVVIIDIDDCVYDTAKELGGEKMGVYAVKCNLLDLNDLKAAFIQAINYTDGKIDILINGAGINSHCPPEELSPGVWEKVIAVNLSALFFMCQEAGKIMLKQGSGKIINIASMNSFIGGDFLEAYSASKGGVLMLTKALSNDWAKQGINVNAIAPGYMATEMTTNFRKSEKGQLYFARIPMGRWGSPEDLKGAVIFLASSASDYISGVTLPVDGGFLGN